MDERQFGAMVDQYEKLIYTICYQMTRDHHTAQDLAQDTFLSAYSHLESCPPENPKAWLARIATNKAKDFLKSAYNRRVCTVEDQSMPEQKGHLFGKDEQPEEIALARETVEGIRDEIHQLKEPYKQVAVLFFLEDRSVDEIARRLERPPKTVHTQIYRAKQKLQKNWKGDARNGLVS